jgi:hypothetical protein
MKKTPILLTIAICISFSTLASAQASGELSDVKYRRSSLHTMLMETSSYPQKDMVMKAYNNAPFPDKYNDHNIGIRMFDPSQFTVCDEDREALGQKKKGLVGKALLGIASEASAGIIDSTASDDRIIIEKYFKAQGVARQLVSKWFNRSEDGSFSFDMVAERGTYNATEMEADIAAGATKGSSVVQDAGIELIGNTFVVVSKLSFVENEPTVRAIRDAAILSAEENSKSEAAKQLAIAAANKLYERTKEGYSVWTTSYLYKLAWNDSIQAVFFNDLWIDRTNPDLSKKEAFDNTDLFSMEFIGSEKSNSLVTFSLKVKRTEEEIIELATVRNVEKVFAKLQKEYDVFKPKTPLLTGEPITAKIGKKEGLEGGEKFEVLEQVINPKTGLTEYKKVGTVSVDKDSLWDNRFNAGTDPEDGEVDNAIDRTTFKGSGKFYAGMLLRQVK